MLCQLDHRGGQGSDPYTGDGAGLMVQLPDAFFRKNCKEFALPEKGRYGVGMVFFSKDDDEKRVKPSNRKSTGSLNKKVKH